MPSKIQLDENLWFLYICLQKSDLKAIDFNAVGLATSLKPPAARMRYTRLKRQIESGLLLTHTTPAVPSSPTLSPSPQPSSLPHPHSSSPSTPASYSKAAPIAVKRKRAIKKPQESGGGGGNSSDGGDEKHLPPHHSHYRSRPSHLGPGNGKQPANKVKREKHKGEIKTEHKSDWSSAASSPFSSFSGSSSASASNSEDEIPLRKRRAQAHAHADTQAHAAQQRSAAPSPSQPATQVVAPGQGMEMAMGQGAMQGYNTYAQAPRAQLGSEGDRGVARGLANMGYTGRGVHASPYVGFIDGRPTPDAMGMPAPGGLGLGSGSGFENGLPRSGLEGEMEREVGQQREDGGENVEGRGMSV